MTKIAGISLILAGLAGLAYGGLRNTTSETVIDIGPIQATREKTHTFPMSPLVGGVAMLTGIILLTVNRK